MQCELGLYNERKCEYLSLQGRMGANVLEETGLVVNPQLLFLLLALLVVLVQLAHLVSI